MTLPSSIQQSSIPLFQDTLKSLLSQRNGLADVEVVIGPPSPGKAQASKWIAMIDVESNEHFATLGRQAREENYEQKIYISVITRDGEDDATSSRDIAFGLRNEVAQQLITNPTVDGTVWQAQIGSKNDFFPRLGVSVPDANDQTQVDLSWREAALYFSIKVKNRLITAF